MDMSQNVAPVLDRSLRNCSNSQTNTINLQARYVLWFICQEFVFKVYVYNSQEFQETTVYDIAARSRFPLRHTVALPRPPLLLKQVPLAHGVGSAEDRPLCGPMLATTLCTPLVLL